jgi:hypothetical protein
MGFVADVSENLTIMLSYLVEFPNGMWLIDSDINDRPLYNRIVRNVGIKATLVPCLYW